MITAWEKLSMAGGCALALLLAFVLGMMFQHRRALPPPPRAGFIQAEAPAAEIRISPNKATIERRISDAGRMSRAASSVPKDTTPTRQAEILAETKTGEKLEFTLTESKASDGTKRLTVEAPEGIKVSGVDYVFPAMPEPREKRWAVLAIARTDFRTGANLGAAVTYRRGRFSAMVAGFRNEAIVGAGIVF